MQNFKGKRAFITGAASGIGRALAKALAEEEVEVALCDWDKGEVEKTLSDIKAMGGKGEAYGLDVSQRDAVHALADKLLAQKGGIDIVINCAGVAQSALIENLTYDDLEWVMGINFFGMVYGTKAFLPHLLQKGEGHIVNVSSVFGLFSVPSQSAYNAAKFGIRGFTEALRHELRETEVVVSSVHPGGVSTNIVRNMRRPQIENVEEAMEEFDQRFQEIAHTSSEDAAQIIIKGMKKGKMRILIGKDAHIMDAIVRLFPVRYMSVMRLMSWRRQDSVEIMPSASKVRD